MTIRTTIGMLAVVAAGVGLTGGPVSAQDLKVALAAEPTSMDPHYQNLTINKGNLERLPLPYKRQDIPAL